MIHIEIPCTGIYLFLFFIAVNCATLFAPVYGRVIGVGNGYGTVLKFECDNGYKVIGSTERRCQADRSWSGQTAKCEGNIDIA